MEGLVFFLNDYRNSPDHSNTSFPKWEHSHGIHWDISIHTKNRDLYIYYFLEGMLNWFLAASEGFLQLFYASVEGLMLIYVVYWNLDIAWWERVQRNHATISKGYKWIPQMRCSILQNSLIQIILNIFYKIAKLKVVYVPIVFLNSNLNLFKLKDRIFHLNIRNICNCKVDRRLEQAAQTGWVLILSPWRYSKPDSTKPLTTCSGWPCFEGSDNLQMVLSNSNHSGIPPITMIISLLTLLVWVIRPLCQ